MRDNIDARRGEAKLLASSTYALRRLNRVNEAKARVDTAFRLLAATNDYPAAAIVPDEAADLTLRAAAEHFAETGEPRRAAVIYDELLRKTTGPHVDIHHDLRHALAISNVYAALAKLHQRNRDFEGAEQLAAQRLSLWSHWERKLPNSVFVRRQLSAARGRLQPKEASIRKTRLRIPAA